jgi:aerotaxis receptor
MLISMLPLLLCLLTNSLTIQALSISIIAGLALAIVLANMTATPYKIAANKARSLYDNPLAQHIFTGRQDELGALELSNQFLTNKLETALWRVADSAQNVEQEAHNTTQLSNATTQASDQQTIELEQLATAMNEMVSTISEVSKSSVEADTEMEHVKTLVNEGSIEVDKTKICIDRLVEGLSTTSTKIKEISESSHTISDLVNAIHSIAEQTNLLALNAAIEAARAGEQGRGFAVVADEVRNLANNTATTTEEIQRAISLIKSDVEDAVAMMETAEQESQQTITQSNNAHVLLQSIRNATEETCGVVIQIATATEEQHAVSEEINRNVHEIQDSANISAKNMSEAQLAYNRLHNEVKNLHNVVTDFTVT